MPRHRAKANLVVSDDIGQSSRPNATPWPKELVSMLGKRPDAEVARLAGCSNESVRRERARRKIDPGRRYISWTDAQIKWLGKRPDAEVARLVGCSCNAVEIMRCRRNIPPILISSPPHCQDG